MDRAMIEVTVSEARERLADLLGKVQHGGDRLRIMRHGKPVAVVVSAAEHDFLEECESLYWAAEVARIQSEPEYDPNDTVPFDQVRAEMLAEDAAE
jgi:prevent-host-death family protein